MNNFDIDKYRPRPGETILQTEQRIMDSNVEQFKNATEQSYDALASEALAAGFPKGQLAELEHFSGQDIKFLAERFEAWQSLYGAPPPDAA